MKNKISPTCRKELKAIKLYLSIFHLMELDFIDTELTTPFRSGRVMGIRYDGEHLSLLLHDTETNLPVTIPESTFASSLDTLTGIYSGLKESIHARSEEIRSRNPIKSQKASRFLKSAPNFCESGGYSENTLIQAVVVAEYELTEKASQNITKLVDEFIEFRKQSHEYHCSTLSFGLEPCHNRDCEQCKQTYYEKIKVQLLKKYQLTDYGVG